MVRLLLAAVLLCVQAPRTDCAHAEDSADAVGQFGPREWRSSTSSKLPDVLCQFEGLSAGRWHITLDGTHTFEIEVDGKNDQTLAVDFSK